MDDDWDKAKRTPKKNTTPASPAPSAAVKEEKKEDFDFDLKLEDGDKKAEVEVKKEDQNKAKKIITKLKAPIKKFQELICGELPDEQKKPITMLEIAFHQISEDLDKFRDGIIKYGCNSQTLWHFVDRLFQQIYNAIEQNEQKFKAQSIAFKDFSKLNESPEMRMVSLYSTLKKDLGYLEQDLAQLKIYCTPEDVSTLDEINKCTEAAVEQSIHAVKTIEEAPELRQIHSGELVQVASKLDRLNKVVRKKTYRVIQIGLEKAGKSTWTNFLIGYDLLPSDDKRCTMIPTYIRNSEGEDILVEIIFFSKIEFDQQMEAYMNSTNNNSKLSADKIEMIRENFKENSNKIIKGKFEDIKTELHAIIKDESQSFYCKQVIINTNKLKSSVPVEIIDFPGYDSTIPSHVMMVLDGIRNADAFIFVTDGSKPNLTAPATRLLTDVMTDGSYNMIKEKGFAILTHIDTLYTKSQGESCTKNATDELLKFGFSPDKVFPACPLFDLMVISKDPMNKEKLGNCENSINKTHTYLKGSSGRAKDVVYKFIQSTLPKSRCSEAAELVNKVKKFTTVAIQHLETKVPNIGNTEDAFETVRQNQIHNNWALNHSEALSAIRAYRFEVASKRHEIFGQIVETFCAGIRDLLEVEESKCRNLQDLAPQLAITLGYVNHEIVEAVERDRLAGYYNKIMESCGTDLVAEEIYNILLSKYYHIYTSRLGCDGVAAMSLQEIIPYEKCKEPVHTLIMRVAYPLAFALIQFSRANALRPYAEEELLTACPEFKEFFHEHQ